MAEPVKLKGLDIILTYECTGRCAHCCYRAGQGRDETMSMAEVEGYLATVADQSLKWVLLFGGEPFLCYDLLRASVALAAQLAGVLVFTNGYWATDPDTARRLLAGLLAASPDCILFSVDAFHQAHTPLERVAIGIDAARELIPYHRGGQPLSGRAGRGQVFQPAHPGHHGPPGRTLRPDWRQRHPGASEDGGARRRRT